LFQSINGPVPSSWGFFQDSLVRHLGCWIEEREKFVIRD
jgi:hypothetical protein